MTKIGLNCRVKLSPQRKQVMFSAGHLERRRKRSDILAEMLALLPSDAHHPFAATS